MELREHLLMYLKKKDHKVIETAMKHKDVVRKPESIPSSLEVRTTESNGLHVE